jgi:hypothetical protein
MFRVLTRRRLVVAIAAVVAAVAGAGGTALALTTSAPGFSRLTVRHWSAADS